MIDRREEKGREEGKGKVDAKAKPNSKLHTRAIPKTKYFKKSFSVFMNKRLLKLKYQQKSRGCDLKTTQDRLQTTKHFFKRQKWALTLA